MAETRLGAWKAIGVLALLIVVVVVPLAPSLRSARRPEEWTTAPPTFAFFVNKRSYFSRSYLRFLNNKLRERYGYEGTVIRLNLEPIPNSSSRRSGRMIG